MSFPFDISEAQRTGTFISGISGSGKSNLAYHLAHTLMDQGIIVYVFDISRTWQQYSSVPYYFTINPNNAQVVYSLSQSMIFDLSLLKIPQIRNVVEKVCESVFLQHADAKNPKPKILFFEESQIYLPQGSMLSKQSAEVMRLITVGRPFKIRYVLITQFASNVDKLCVKNCKQRYLGFTDERNDKLYLKSFIGPRVNELETLKVGEFIYSCGARTERIKTPLFERE